MYKVGVCGNFGGGQTFFGQTVKTKILTEELQNQYGINAVTYIDTYEWKKKSISLFAKCFMLLKNCEKIIIMPAHNGVKVFIPLFLFFNILFNRKLYYVVIGGWLHELLNSNLILKVLIAKFDKIYVESQYIIEKLQAQGLNNVGYLTNFKRLDILLNSELDYSVQIPYKLCILSRVMEKKGIEDAIKVIVDINESYNENIFALDIYGPIDVNYVNRFNELKRNFPVYINYKGIIDYNQSVTVLKKYFALLFPTRFRTEGIPGTIIDAYAAGLPVLASKWNSYSDIIDEGLTGLTFKLGDIENIKSILIQIYNNPRIILEMKSNCIRKAKNFIPEYALRSFFDEINKK